MEQGGRMQAVASTGRLVLRTGTVLGVVGGSLVVVATPASAATLTVTTTADSGPGSLRQALADAVDGDTIVFDLPADSTITLGGNALDVSTALTPGGGLEIQGPGAADLTIDAAGNSGVFYVYPSAPGPVTISGITITGGSQEQGGGVYAQDVDLLLDSVVVDQNEATAGGGVMFRGGDLSIQDSTISGNLAQQGAGVMVSPRNDTEVGTVDIASTTIIGNGTKYEEGETQSGGGILISDKYENEQNFDVNAAAIGETGQVTITGSTIQANTARKYGGIGVIGSDADVTISSTLIGQDTFVGNFEEIEEENFLGNVAQVGGGVGFVNAFGDLSITNSEITGNVAGFAGGVKYFNDRFIRRAEPNEVRANVVEPLEEGLTISGSSVSGNLAVIDGGGIGTKYGAMALIDTTVSQNYAGSSGGGVWARSAEIIVGTSTISGNEADNGAGLDLNDSFLYMLNSTVSGNAAYYDGGGIHERSSFAAIGHSTIANNSAGYAGGGIYSDYFGEEQATANAVVPPQYADYYDPNVLIDHTIVGDNTAVDDGNDVTGVVEAKYSLVEDVDSASTLVIDGGGNIFSEDPDLGILKSNGGPTKTHLPDGDSPVVDAGDIDESGFDPGAEDQRGEDRVAGDAVDIGAVETDEDDVTVAVVATATPAVEGGTEGEFTFTRTGPTSSGLTVGYSVSGTATAGEDYEALGTITFLPGQSTVVAPVVALADEVEDDNETVIVTVLSGSGYTPASPISDTVTIVEDEVVDDPCADADEAGFTDVSESNVHKDAIDCLKALGITEGGPQGLPADQYGPGLSVNRGQIASFLARLIETAGTELPEASGDSFPDDDGSVHEDNINRLVEAGVIEGKDDGTFGVDDSVRRDQMASLLARTYEYITGAPLPAGDDAFTDDDGNVHEDAINALAEAGIVLGTGTPGIYDPTGDVKRDQMASFLIRLAQLLAAEGNFTGEVGEVPTA